MEMLFLGTASGTPTKTRNVSALAVRSRASRQWTLVDCGEGTQHRILHTSLSLASLEAICITHVHGDHCYGLPGLLASAGMLNRTERLWIAGPPAVHDFISSALGTTGLRLPFPLEFIDVEKAAENGGGVMTLKDFHVRAVRLSHRVPSYAYSFCERAVDNKLDAVRLRRDGVPAGPLWGRLQAGRDVELPDGRLVSAAAYLLPARKPRKLIVAGDNDTPELLTAEAQSAEAVVHEATYTEEALNKIGPGPQHSSALRVARWAEAVRIPNLVLTHFSPRYVEQKAGVSALDALANEAAAHYTGRLFLANDLETYALDMQGVLAKKHEAPKGGTGG